MLGGLTCHLNKSFGNRGALIKQVCCVIDREDEGRNNIENMGLLFTPLFTISELAMVAGG